MTEGFDISLSNVHCGTTKTIFCSSSSIVSQEKKKCLPFPLFSDFQKKTQKSLEELKAVALVKESSAGVKRMDALGSVYLPLSGGHSVTVCRSRANRCRRTNGSCCCCQTHPLCQKVMPEGFRSDANPLNWPSKFLLGWGGWHVPWSNALCHSHASCQGLDFHSVHSAKSILLCGVVF